MSHFEKVSFEQWKADCGLSEAGDDELRRLHEAIVMPAQATAGSAGMDFNMPYGLKLEAGAKVKIASGIRWVTDDNEKDRVLLMMPRSGLGFKYGIRLSNTVGVIDSDYCNADNEGHIVVALENPSNECVMLDEGKPFVQGIIVRYELADGAVSGGERHGGFGSTSK